LCGYDLLKQESEATEKESDNSPRVIANFKMKEIDLLERSGFSWTVLELAQEAMIASGFNSWCCVLKQNDNTWSTIGGSTKKGEESNKQVPSKVVYSGNKAQAIEAGNAFLYRFEDEEAARKTASWRGMSPSESQLKWLPEKYKASDQLTKGDASNYLTFIFNAQPKLRELGFVL
jgi:hypothetical protein